MDLDPDRPTIDAILLRAGKMLPEKAEGNPDLLDLVRVVHVALARGAVKPKDVESLRARLSPLYPAHDVRLNRELVRILVYLQDPTLARRLVDQLLAGIPLEEQIHVAMHAPFLKTGWDAKLRGEVLAFFEQARSLEGGVSYRSHLTIATNDFLKMLTPLEQLELIASGARTPVVTLGLIQNLPVKPSPEQLAALKKLDQSIAQEKSEAAHDLAKAAVNVLVRGDANSLAYLYGVFEANPERRPDVARALALAAISSRQYHKQDQALLVRSLASIDGSAGRDVLRALARYPQHESAGPILRQVILLGLKLGEQGGADAVTLLETWTGQRLPTKGVGDLGLAAWQDWFRKKYADLPDPSLPLEAAGTKWTYNGLLDFINSAAGMQGDAQAGAKVFEKALCIKCHRFGTRGEGVGPDLTDVRKRFQRKEILESVMFPSAVISDLFQAKVVTTQSGLTYVGIVGPLPGGGITVFQANAEKVTIKKDDIDTQEKSKLSAMPEGLFNKLELKEIADLFAYLTAGAPQNGKSVAGK